VKVKVKVKLVDGGKAPEYKHDDDACADCYARLSTEYIILLRGKRTLVPLGFCMEIPSGYEAVIRPRSGNSKKGIDVAIGTVDAGYRGEVMANVINNSDEDFFIHNLDRICQIKIQRAEQAVFETVDELSETDRGNGGFGSTGVN